MKILLVRREPNVALSMDVYADNLVAQLRQLRPQWTIAEIAPEPWGTGDNYWHTGSKWKKFYERFWRHPLAVRRCEADIIHIIDHTNGHIAYWLKSHQQVGQRPGMHSVMTCHDLVQFVYPEILRDQSRWPALSMASWKFSVNGLKKVDTVVAVSGNTAHDVQQYLQIEPQRIAIVPNGVEPNFSPAASAEVARFRQAQGLPDNALCLLNVGSTHQRKNIPAILKALCQLKREGLPVFLWRVGEAFTDEQQSLVTELGLSEVIVETPRLSNDELGLAYRGADILLAPSLYEGFGLTLIEAMACGTPVITGNVSSIPEVVGDGAVLVEPTDITAITAAVHQLHTDPTYRKQLITKGMAQAKKLTWKAAAEKLIGVYEKLVV